MNKVNDTHSFIDKAKIIHRNKYDYSKVEYVNYVTKVCIICPIHGEFWQTPKNHLNGSGCSLCGNEQIGKKHRATRSKVGYVKDLSFVCKMPSYEVWDNMIRRCYHRGNNKKWMVYEDCYVCEEWLCFDNFNEWFSKNYVEGWQLDKDILVESNREYSPDKCCFVPREINNLFKRFPHSDVLPQGVKKVGKKFCANIQSMGNRYYLGSFETKEEAHKAYMRKRKELIQNVVDKYKDKLKHDVYKALTNKY